MTGPIQLQPFELLSDFPWKPILDSVERQEIVAEVDAFAPTFQRDFKHDSLEVERSVLSFYEDYSLLRIEDGERTLLALYAPGDVRPLDSTEGPIRAVNFLAPIILSEVTVVDYIRFYLSCVAETSTAATFLENADSFATAEGVSKKEAKKLARHIEPIRLAELSETSDVGDDAPEELKASDNDDDTPDALNVSVIGIAAGGLGRYRIEVSSRGRVKIVDDVERLFDTKVEIISQALGSDAFPVIGRLPTIHGVKQWRIARDDELHDFRSAFDAEGWRCPSPAGWEKVILRIAEVDFWVSHLICELIADTDEGLQHRHMIMDMQKHQLSRLYGTSPQLHEINAAETSRRSEPPLSDPAGAIAYTRFFCWAIKSEGGRFLIVDQLRAIPWKDAPSSMVREELKAKLCSLESSGIDDEKRYQINGTVSYGDAMFQAEFAVSQSGMVEMVDDEPIAQNLSVLEEAERDRANLPLEKLGETTAAQVKHYLNRPIGDDREDPDRQQPIAAEKFLSDLAAKGLVDDVAVSGRVSFTRLPSGKGISGESDAVAEVDVFAEYRVINVTFLDEVEMNAVRLLTPLDFRLCRFEKGFSASNARARAGLRAYRCEFHSVDGETPAISINDIEVEGNLDFRANDVFGRLYAPRMRVSGNVRFDGIWVTLKGFKLPDEWRLKQETLQTATAMGFNARWVPPPALYLRGSEIGGTLDLGGFVEEVVAGRSGDSWNDNTIFPRISVIAGGVGAVGVKVGRFLRLRGACVFGYMDFQGSHIGLDVQAHALIRKLADSDRTRACRFIVTEWVSFHGARIDGSLLLSGALIFKDLHCMFTIVQKMFIGGPCEIADRTFCSLRIGGDLLLSGANVGYVQFEAAHVEGDIKIVTGQFIQLFFNAHLRVQRVDEGVAADMGSTASQGSGQLRLALEPSHAHAVYIKSVNVAEDLALGGIRLGGDGHSSKTIVDEHSGVLHVTGSKIGGNLALGTNGYAEKGLAGKQAATLLKSASADPADIVNYASDSDGWALIDSTCQAEIGGRLKLSGTQVKGGVDVSNVIVAGPVDLTDMKIGQDLRISRFGRGQSGIQGRESVFVTRCSSLNIEMLECEGDIDLTGLETGKLASGRGRGAVDGPYLTVKGDLEFWPRAEIRCTDSCGAMLGDLNLSAAKVGRLILTGKNWPKAADGVGLGQTVTGRWQRVRKTFDQMRDLFRRTRRRAPTPATPPINLERARIGRLDIRSPLPADINLDSIIVDAWDLENDDVYRKLLKKTEPFSGGVYTQVETSLRDEGNDTIADAVYVDMRRRLRRDKGWYRNLSSWLLLDITTRYGTSPTRPFISILVIALLNWVLLSNPSNIVASTAYLETFSGTQLAEARLNAQSRLTAAETSTAPAVLDVSPNDIRASWGRGDAAAITIRFTVPLIGLAMTDRWEPARSDAVVPCWLTGGASGEARVAASTVDGAHRCAIGMKAVTLVRMLGYLSWIVWPMFIYGVSNLFKRRI